MLQEFVLEVQVDIDTIISLCQYAYIDRTKSIGSHFAAPSKQNVAIKREGAVVRVKAPSGYSPSKSTAAITRARNSEKISFLDIMRDLIKHKTQKSLAITYILA